MDLAKRHLAAFSTLLAGGNRLLQLNLASGQGHTVLEVIKAFGQLIPHVIADRRSGDAAITVADPTEAKHQIAWQTRLTLDDICHDGWRWQQANSNG